LVDALSNGLSKGCRKFFGEGVLQAWANEAANKITVIDLARREAQGVIPGFEPRTTFSQYWSRAPSAAAQVVGNSTGVFPFIITGPGFGAPEMYNRGALAMFNWNVQAFQEAGIVHEFLHWQFQKNDVDLANDLGLNGKGYGYSDTNSASLAIQSFFANDCQAAPKKRK
jgi:hypothetical protein